MTETPFHIIHHPVVDSTQDTALEFLRINGPGAQGVVILADHQTKGRGRQGRVWDTPPAGNLAATLIWHITDQNPVHVGNFSLRVAVALRATLAAFLPDPTDLKIKWPNDLMLKGRKCAGILLERPEPEWLLIGTGANVVYAPEHRACLADVTPAPPTARDVLEQYLTHFLKYAEADMDQVRSEWTAHAFGLNEPMTVRTARDEFQAIFKGLDQTGAARVQRLDGSIRLIHAGDVFF